MTIEEAQNLLKAANEAMQSGNLQAGEDLLEKFFVLQPNHAGALDLAARAHLALGKVDIAYARANQAVAQQSTIPFVLTLAEATKAKGDLQQSAQLFHRVVEQSPQELRALRGLGEIYEISGFRRRAIDYYKAFLTQQPDGLQIAIKYSNLLSIPELTTGLQALERARPAPGANSQFHLLYLSHAVVYKEWAERARRHLMPYHATRMDELFFTFAASDRDEYGRIADNVLATKPHDRASLAAKASTLFSLGRRVEAEAYFKKMATFNKGSIHENINFQPDYFSRLTGVPDEFLSAKLPPVLDILPAHFNNEHVIYLSCNHKYFVDFARTMLLSINGRTRHSQVHLHIMEGNDGEWEDVKRFCTSLTNIKLAISGERPGLQDGDMMVARCYYHAIRFVRLYNHLKHYKKTLWLMDVDAFLHQDPQPMFAAIGTADTAFRVRPARWEPWNQFNASVMAIAPTTAGINYLRMIAAYVADYYQNSHLRWGVDQLAMYAVYAHLQDVGRPPKVHLLDDRAVDYECNDDSFVWCNSGRGKFLQLKLLAKGAEEYIDADRSKYFDALKVYARQLAEYR
jgi:tetratricopeptide (TPR) repeat protein